MHALCCVNRHHRNVNVTRPYLFQPHNRRQPSLTCEQIADDCHLHEHILRRRTQSHAEVGNSFKFAHVIRFCDHIRFARFLLFLRRLTLISLICSSNVCQVANKYRKTNEKDQLSECASAECECEHSEPRTF